MQTLRGSIVVLEGLDRAGKSTLAMMLAEHLQNNQKKGRYYKYPNRTTPIGKMIDSYLKQETQLDDHAIHLLFSANRWELNSEMRRSIYEGQTLVIDRYSYSGVAYSGAKKGMDLKWCYQPEIGLPRPDLVIYMALSADEQKKRHGFGDERYEHKEFQDLIRDNYKKIFQQIKEDANKNNEEFHLLNIIADGKSPDDLLQEILEPVYKCIETNANQPLRDIA